MGYSSTAHPDLHPQVGDRLRGRKEGGTGQEANGAGARDVLGTGGGRSLVAGARGTLRSPCKERSRQRWARAGPGEGKGSER